MFMGIGMFIGGGAEGDGAEDDVGDDAGAIW